LNQVKQHFCDKAGDRYIAIDGKSLKKNCQALGLCVITPVKPAAKRNVHAMSQSSQTEKKNIEKVR